LGRPADALAELEAALRADPADEDARRAAALAKQHLTKEATPASP
jgi:Tfp pilus assembly protein PilF